MSIDEMIAAGRTLPEIQAELRKLVAARDENDLKAARLKCARDKATNAMAEYFTVLGIPQEEITRSTFDKMWADFEAAIAPALKVLADPKTSIKAEIKAAPAVTNDTEKDLDWFRDFVAHL